MTNDCLRSASFRQRGGIVHLKSTRKSQRPFPSLAPLLRGLIERINNVGANPNSPHHFSGIDSFPRRPFQNINNSGIHAHCLCFSGNLLQRHLLCVRCVSFIKHLMNAAYPVIADFTKAVAFPIFMPKIWTHGLDRLARWIVHQRAKLLRFTFVYSSEDCSFWRMGQKRSRIIGFGRWRILCKRLLSGSPEHPWLEQTRHLDFAISSRITSLYDLTKGFRFHFFHGWVNRQLLHHRG